MAGVAQKKSAAKSESPQVWLKQWPLEQNARGLLVIR